MGTAAIATRRDRAPRRVQRLIDLAAKWGLKVEETTDQSEPLLVTTLQVRTWTFSPTKYAWDTSQVWVHWSKFRGDRSMGSVRVTWYHLNRKTTEVRLRDAWSVLRVLAGQ